MGTTSRGGTQGVGLQRCAERLAECLTCLRLVRHELDKQRKWLEGRALRLDCLIGDIDLVLGEAPDSSSAVKGRTGTRGSRSSARPEVTLSSINPVVRGDGYWDVSVDAVPPFRLPPLLGRLFALLAKDTGHDVGDGLVGFKSNASLLTELHRLSMLPLSARQGAVGRLNARGLAQAVCDLRKRLAGAVVQGDSLVQTRRGVGRRIALRRSERSG